MVKKPSATQTKPPAPEPAPADVVPPVTRPASTALAESDHPPWCYRPLCTATAVSGAHRSVRFVLRPNPLVVTISLYLSQLQARGPDIEVLGIGTLIPLSLAASLSERLPELIELAEKAMADETGSHG